MFYAEQGLKTTETEMQISTGCQYHVCNNEFECLTWKPSSTKLCATLWSSSELINACVFFLKS